MNDLVLVCVQKLKQEEEEEEGRSSVHPPTVPSSSKAINKWIDFWTSDSFPS